MDQVADEKSADWHEDCNLDYHCFGPVSEIGSCDEQCSRHNFGGAGTPCFVRLSEMIKPYSAEYDGNCCVYENCHSRNALAFTLARAGWFTRIFPAVHS